MGASVTRDVQRATVLLETLILILVITFLTIKLMKKRIDLHSRPSDYHAESESATDKVK